MSALLEMEEKLAKSYAILEKKFNYHHKKKLEDRISVKAIHKKICKKTGKGKLKYKNNKLILDDEKGVPIYAAIRKILSLYEYIGIGVYQCVFDKETIKAFYKSSIIRYYNIFKDYIQHVNDMYPSYEGKIWINFVELAKEFEESKKKPKSDVSPM